jgi:diazepam-binding inhibitor (GABA receptor modulating acyl-CoA-binding protein)
MSDYEDELQERFEKAAKHAQKFVNADNDTLLDMYSHYKQATVGNCDISSPGFWDIKGKAKYNAWKKLEGMSNDKAKKKYIKIVKKLEKSEK